MPAISVMEKVRSASRITLLQFKAALQTITQAITSVNNLLLTLAVASIDPTNGLGRFNLGFTVYICALGLSRAMVVEPMLVGKIGKTYAGAQKMVLGLGFAVGLAVAGAGYSTDDYLLVAVGASLPVLLFLDLVRYKHLRTGRPEITLVMDSIWISAVALVWLYRPYSVEWVILYWLVGGAVALLVGMAWQGSVTWKAADLKSFFRVAKGISIPSAIESLIFQFVWQLPFAIFLSLISLTAAGEYRAAVTLMAPLGVVVASWTLSSYGKLRDLNANSRKVYGLASKIGLLSCAYLLLCLFLREELSRLLFHSVDAVSIGVLLLTGLQLPIQAYGSQLAVWFKVQRQVMPVLLGRGLGSFGLVAVLCIGVNLNSPLILIASMPSGILVHVLTMIFLRRRLLRRLPDTTLAGSAINDVSQ